MNAAALATTKLAGIPAWGWAALVGGGGLAVYAVRRRSTNGQVDTLGSSYGPLTRDSLDSVGGGGSGGYGSSPGSTPATPDVPRRPRRPRDVDTPRLPDESGYRPPMRGPERNPSPLSDSAAVAVRPGQSVADRTAQITQAARDATVLAADAGTRGDTLAVGLTPISGKTLGVITSQSTVTNAAGSAVRAMEKSPYYTASALDLQSERTGGLKVQQAARSTSDAAAGKTYTVVSNSSLGTGPVVPASQRVVGERYDKFGRVIL